MRLQLILTVICILLAVILSLQLHKVQADSGCSVTTEPITFQQISGL
jgi:hypothetical protein